MGDFLDPYGPQPAPLPGKGTAPPPSDKEAEQDTRPGVLFFKDYFAVEAVRAKHFWVLGEYLIWHVKNSPPTFPLVTTDSNPAASNAGSLASPTVIPLFGPSGFRYSALNGARLTLGGWFDCHQQFGLEGSGFILQKRTSSFSAASDNNGNPSLYIPAYNVALGKEDRLLVSNQGTAVQDHFVGSVTIVSALQLWGADVSGVFNVFRGNHCDIDLLAGFRYLDLNEVFQLQNTSAGVDSVISINDRFQAHNQFYGAQIGARVNYVWCRVLASMTTKLAVGGTLELVDISGSTTQSGLVNGTFPGGFFAQASNSGLHQRSLVSVVPQVGGTLGYNLTSRLTFFAGYDFLYWTNVARAGEQIDRNLNLTQSPTFGSGVLSGSARPQFLHNSSDFFAHGTSLSLQYRY